MLIRIDIPEDLWRQLRTLIASQGVTLESFAVQAIENELARGGSPVMRRRRFPRVTSKEPGSLHLTNAEIEDLLT